MRDRQETTSWVQYTRVSAETVRVHSAGSMRVHGTGSARTSCKLMRQHIQSPGACVYWRARVEKCMASGAPADIQTYSVQCKPSVKEQSLQSADNTWALWWALWSTSRRLPLPMWPLPSRALFFGLAFSKNPASWALPFWAWAGLCGAVDLSMWQPST